MASPTVLVVVHAPSVPISSERRLPNDVPLNTIKARLELLCGVPPAMQRLSLYSSRTDDPDGHPSLLARWEVTEEDKTLQQLGVQEGMGILLDDLRDEETRDRFGEEAEAKVEKYEMDDEAYARRADTVLAYKQRMKMGRFGETASNQAVDQSTAPLPDSFQPGARCEVEGGRRGTIRFVGSTDFAPGTWIGVQYDEPVGKNDGSVGGRRYFTCPMKYGGFVKVDKVNVGDYPERSIEDEMDDEEEM